MEGWPGMDHMNPFAMPVTAGPAERRGAVDLYPPDASEPRPAIVFVPGGPVPAAVQPRPRDWPVFRGYGAMAAAAGVMGVVVDHRLHTPSDYAVAAEDVVNAIGIASADPRVDADRLVLWFFSGGALLVADWLRTPPSWLRCVGTTYPVLAPLPGWSVDQRFHPAGAIAGAGDLPIVLTQVGRENELIAAGIREFVEAAEANASRLDIIDVPNGQHGFDYLDHTEETREAIELAFGTVLATLR